LNYLAEQLEEIIRTDETLSVSVPAFIRLEAEPLAVVDEAVVDDAPRFAWLSTVPVTSMRWPTWLFS